MQGLRWVLVGLVCVNTEDSAANSRNVLGLVSVNTGDYAADTVVDCGSTVVGLNCVNTEEYEADAGSAR